MYTSEKLYSGYTTCFRQHTANGSSCAFLHGYSVSFKVVYQGELDKNNWVFDFGGFKRSSTRITPVVGSKKEYFRQFLKLSIEDYFKDLFDHTVIISRKDPARRIFEKLADNGAVKLRVLPKVGCESFAKHIFTIMSVWIAAETDKRVSIKSVTFFENNNNSATYSE